jgi:hypothetical protein
MISISGIKYQKELEILPYLNKFQARMLTGKEGRNLDKKLEQLKKIGYLKTFKKNMYVSDSFYQQIEKGRYAEYIANTLRSPSYISLEYILAKESLIPEGVFSITSITRKSSRIFRNFLGTFAFRNIKEVLFTGYREETWEGKIIRRASKAKALFDFLYLKKLSNIEKEITTDLRINWGNFSANDFSEFKTYVILSKSKKMMRITNVIYRLYFK